MHARAATSPYPNVAALTCMQPARRVHAASQSSYFRSKKESTRAAACRMAAITPPHGRVARSGHRFTVRAVSHGLSHPQTNPNAFKRVYSIQADGVTQLYCHAPNGVKRPQFRATVWWTLRVSLCQLNATKMRRTLASTRRPSSPI
jgi:hypothetical protein